MHDEDSMSENGGQLATMPNGCFSSSLFLGQSHSDSPTNLLSDVVANGTGHTSGNNNGDMNGMSASSSSNEYGGYQMSFLSGSKLTSNFR